MKSNTKQITYGGLLLALAIVFQNLRLIPFLNDANPISVFVIGSLVNLVIIVACAKVGLWSAVFIGIIAPLFALMQGHIKLPFMVGMVALGNIVLALGYRIFKNKPKMKWLGVIVGALAKYGFFVLTVPLAFSWFMGTGVPTAVAANFLGFAQLITALIGGFLATLVLPILEKNSPPMKEGRQGSAPQGQDGQTKAPSENT